MLKVASADSLPFPDEHFQCIITSPPYWKARNYGHGPEQLGFEDGVADYIDNLVAMLDESRRVLRKDGTLWVNLGDSYNTRAMVRDGAHNAGLGHSAEQIGPSAEMSWAEASAQGLVKHSSKAGSSLKDKDLVLIPSRFAIAMVERGWYLRSEIIWSKPFSKPDRAQDRPSIVHEKIYLFTRSEQYFFDKKVARVVGADRSVWEIPPASGIQTLDGETVPAMFPPNLVERCLLPSTRLGDRVLDPFAGSGVTVLVAERNGREGCGTDLTDRWFPPHASSLLSLSDPMDSSVQLELM